MVQAIAPKRNDSPRYVGLRLSADEYLALPDDGFKYQVINGVVLMSPSPTPRHQRVLSRIITQFEVFLESNPIADVFPDIDVRFAADLVYRPDLAVVLSGRLSNSPPRIDVAPDIIVEILSPGSEAMDERTKLADYERFGVKEYWLVSPAAPLSVRVFRLQGGKLVQTLPGTLDSAALPGFRLNLESIRRALRD